MGSGYTSKMYLKKPILDKRGKSYPNVPEYDKSIQDSFENFSFDGYTNIEIPINFGSKKNKKISPVYYSATKMKKFTAEIFFTIINNLETPELELYYGKKLISKIKH